MNDKSPPPQQVKRDGGHAEEIDAVRFLCNLLVVLLHASAATQYVTCHGVEYWVWQFLFGDFATILLPTLFLLSGYLLFRNYSNSSYKRKLFGRAKRLAVPYVAWNVVFVAVFCLFALVVPRAAARVEQFGLDTWRGCFEKVLSFSVHPMDGPLWFIRTLFVFSLFAPVFDWCYRKLPTWAIVALAVAPVALCAFFPAWAMRVRMTYPPYAFALFALGGLMASRRVSLVGWFQARRRFFLPLGALSMAAGFIAFGLCGLRHVPVLDALKMMAMAPLLWTLSTPMTRVVWRPWVRQTVAPASFFIYAGHFLFASTMLHLCAPFVPDIPGKLTLLCFVFVGLGIPVCWVAHRCARALSPRLTKIFDGSL